MSLSVSEQKEAADQIRDRFLTSDLIQKGGVVAGYSPVRGEVDGMPLLLELQSKGHPVALPRITGDLMAFIVIADTETLSPGAFGIPEPVVGEEITPDILFVPLLGFDVTGHRLGYGKGYYDRYLSQPAAARARRIGIAYDWQEIPRLPAEPHDVRLHALITDKRLIRFEKE